jgi:Cu(I)/Ag(I) efflux system membrane fusion protein
MTRNKAAGIAFLAILILAAIFSYPHLSISWRNAHATAAAAPALPGINPAGQGKVWVCPMHPEIMQDHPGTCPICGMDLVEARHHAGHDHGIQVDSATLQKLGVRLAVVKKAPVSLDVNAYGNVSLDEGRLYSVHSKFDGWIKKSYIHSVGQHIEKGQAIYEIYSPDLVMQQKAYLAFLVRRNQIMQSIGDARMEENEFVMDLLQDLARERMKFLHENVSLDTVQRLEDTRMPIDVVKIVSDESGVVTQINAREGSATPPSTALFTLGDVSRVWVTATLYPDQAAGVKVGDEITLTGADGQRIQSRLDFLSPLADNNKVTARASVVNAHLRPGSFVDVTIHTQPRVALVLPRSAVIHTGHGDMVMIARGDGHFLPAYIDTGVETQDSIEVTDGLQAGAKVVVNGQFLLDSAASLNAAAQRMMSDQHTKHDAP